MGTRAGGTDAAPGQQVMGLDHREALVHQPGLELVVLAGQDGPAAPWPSARWGRTRRTLADQLVAELLVAAVAVLAAMDIDLTKVRGWLNRRDDPTFRERVRGICGLYLSPPERALVLSVDEKTSIQTKRRRHPDQPARHGRTLLGTASCLLCRRRVGTGPASPARDPRYCHLGRPSRE